MMRRYRVIVRMLDWGWEAYYIRARNEADAVRTALDAARVKYNGPTITECEIITIPDNAVIIR